MFNEKDLVDNVSDVHTRSIQARHRLRPANGKQGTLEQEDPEAMGNAFPYLEKFTVVTKKHPYAVLAAMISVASIVVAAIVTVSVAVFTGVFLMYGTMRDIQAKQQVIIEQQTETKGDMKVMRTYSASTLARQDFMVGMMTRDQQEKMNAYDRTNPRLPLPEMKGEKKQ